MCRLVAVTFPNNYTCRLHLHDGNCTDMSGAIKFAKVVTKHLEEFALRSVETFAAGEPDTIYFLRSNGEWGAHEGAQPR
jgi:hypothetical protein